jgi:hypothetical protein
MSANIYNYYSAGWVDLNLYIVNADEVSNVLANRDKSLIIESINVEIAGTIRNDRGNDYEFSEGDGFYFELDGDFIFGGYIDTCEFNYSSLTFQIVILNSLNNLKNVIIEYNSLHAGFASGSNWWDYNANAYSFDAAIISVLWMLKSMFVASGLTLDISTVEETELFTRTPGAPLGFDPAVTIKYKHLIVVEEMLWCINQGVARSHTKIDSTANTYNLSKIYCWDLIKDLFSYLNLGIKQTGYLSFELNAFNDNYTIVDDSKYEYARRKIRPESLSSAVTISYNYHDQISEYKSDTETLINSHNVVGYGRESISFYNNFIIWFTDVENNDPDFYDASVVATIFNPQVDSNFILANNTNEANFNPVALKVREKIAASLEEEIGTEYQSTFRTVKSHNIDLGWSKSKIVQETFDV